MYIYTTATIVVLSAHAYTYVTNIAAACMPRIATTRQITAAQQGGTPGAPLRTRIQRGRLYQATCAAHCTLVRTSVLADRVTT